MVEGIARGVEAFVQKALRVREGGGMRRLSVLVVLAMAVSLLSAAPLGADDGYRGVIDADFNAGFGNLATPCSEMSWYGTVDFGSEEYGLLWVSLGGDPGPTLFRFADMWLLYENYSFVVDGDGNLTECMGIPVIWGYDAGTMRFVDGWTDADGHVEWVDPDGPFPEELVGNRMMWRGTVAGPEFDGVWKIWG